jgi:4-diphosphocytidyl-2-C-methyl-D-erythritol kinase
MRPIRIRAPAKVNLRLCVLAREESGFHTLETLFQAISLADDVEIRSGPPGIGLEVTGGVDTGPREENLTVRAAEAFHAHIGEPPGLRITLHKRIPAAAGLGGGSSDAAAVLRALNAAFGGRVADAALLDIGARLGSDVPFFLGGAALALAWGRGDRLLGLPPLPERPVLVAHPGEAVSTRKAFEELAARRHAAGGHGASVLDLATLASWRGVAAVAGNDFQPLIREAIPSVDTALRILLEAGAEIALLAGSGGSVFGIFPASAPLETVAERLRGEGLGVWSARTLMKLDGPEVEAAERVR